MQISERGQAVLKVALLLGLAPAITGCTMSLNDGFGPTTESLAVGNEWGQFTEDGGVRGCEGEKVSPPSPSFIIAYSAEGALDTAYTRMANVMHCVIQAQLGSAWEISLTGEPEGRTNYSNVIAMFNNARAIPEGTCRSDEFELTSYSGVTSGVATFCKSGGGISLRNFTGMHF